MKKTIKALKLPSIFLLMLISFIACDKDFSVIDSDVLGKENSNFNTGSNTIPVLAYNRTLEALQINGLASYLLGVFDDPAYGKTTASIITQVSPTSFSPNFGDNPVIDSVILTIPYLSRVIGADEDSNPTYTIQDSLYGDYDPNIDVKPFKLSVYQNNYFLRDFDPNAGLDGTQRYYSKADGLINNTDNFGLNGSSTINFDDNKGALILESTITPSANAIELWVKSTDTVKTRIAPALRMPLDSPFWANAIINKEDQTVFSNSNNFNDYFRGLYFKAESEAGSGSMVLLNMLSQEANITIYYNPDSTVAEDERTQSSYVLNFSGNILNTFINDYNLVNLQDGDEVLGDETLYLKGVEGSMAVVDLFENDAALDDFIDEYRVSDGQGGYKRESGNGDYLLKKLINEAQLIIHEDEIMQTFPKDENENDYSTFHRIYAYDINNSQPTIDYLIDPTENTQAPFNSRFISLGQRLEDGEEGSNIFKYKIRLTEHLNSILLKDSTNTKIGLVLSTNVNYTNNAQILDSNDDVDAIPAAALLTPRGTILYGSNALDAAKKMRLEIFFTEPNN